MSWMKQLLRRGRHSFHLRLFLAMALVVFLFIPGAGYIAYLQARKAIDDQMRQHANSTVSQITRQVRSFIAQHSDNVQLIKLLLEHRLINPADEQALLRYFQLFKQGHPEFVNIYYGDAGGRFVMAPPQAPEVFATYDPRVRPWYTGAARTGLVHWTEIYLFASARQPGITVSAPVFDEHGDLRGVSAIDLDLSAFSRFLQGIDIGRQGFAYILDKRRGHVIAHPSLSQLPYNMRHIDLMRRCRDDLTSRGAAAGMTTFQGEQFYTVHADFPGQDWTVGVTLLVSDYMRTIRAVQWTTLTLVLVGILLSGLLSSTLAMAVIRPLRTLRQGIERISRGDLDHKVEIDDPDMVSDLAAAFNRMAASLRASLTELRATYAELAENEKLATVGRMTAGIAHEIRNPLGVIHGSAQIVVNRDRPWEMRERAARFIIDEVTRLDATLKSFLTFARPANPSFRRTDLLLLLEETLVATEERYREEGYTVVRDFPAMVPAIEADPDQIRQVIWNVALNALKAMPGGGVLSLRLQVEPGPPPVDAGAADVVEAAVVEGRWVVVTVADSGCGIAEEQMRHIFDPFVSYRDDGTGLGLSIVHQIVRLHRGHVRIHSRVGEGTAVALYFPCAEEGNPSC
jgi:signal transduction histidine kinase